MTKEQNFFKRHKNKLTALCVFSFVILCFANYIGFQHIPGHTEHLVQNFIGRYFVKEERPIDFERVQYISDSLQAEGEKSNEVTHAISGNFDGTGFIDYAFISPNSGHIVFSKGKAFSVVDLIELNPNDDKLFEEGDLDNDGADDFSVYRYKKGLRNKIITYLHSDNSPWTRCLTIDLNSDKKATDVDIEARVFRKNNQIYFLDEVKDEKTNKYKLVSKSLKNFKTE